MLCFILSYVAGVCFGEASRASGIHVDRKKWLCRLFRHYCWRFPWPRRACAALLLSERRQQFIQWDQRNEYEKGNISYWTSNWRYRWFLKNKGHTVYETRNQLNKYWIQCHFSCFNSLPVCLATGTVHVKLRAWNVFSSLQVDMVSSCGKDSVINLDGPKQLSLMKRRVRCFHLYVSKRFLLNSVHCAIHKILCSFWFIEKHTCQSCQIYIWYNCNTFKHSGYQKYKH